jgi:hypothetical protein
MTNTPIMEADIIFTFAFLKNKNSSVYDVISDRFLTVFGKFCGEPVVHIFNKWLTVGKFPDHMEIFCC